MAGRAEAHRPAGHAAAAGSAARTDGAGAARADSGCQRHAAPLCRVAAGRPAGQRTRTRPVGVAQRCATHRAGPGCIGCHRRPRPAGADCLDAGQPRRRPLERRPAAAARADTAVEGAPRRPEPPRRDRLRCRTGQRARGRGPAARQRTVGTRRLARRHPADRAAPGAGRCPRTRHAPRRPAAARRQRLRCRHARCGAGQRARAARRQPARPGAGTAGAGAAGRAAERAAHRIARTAGAIGRGPGHAVGPGRAAHPQRRLGAHRPGHAARVRSAALVAGSRRLALAQGAAPAECRHRVRPGTAGSRRQRQHAAAAGPRARQRFAGRGAQPAGRRAAERHAVTGHWRRRPEPWPAAARCRRQPPAR